MQCQRLNVTMGRSNTSQMMLNLAACFIASRNKKIVMSPFVTLVPSVGIEKSAGTPGHGFTKSIILWVYTHKKRLPSEYASMYII